MRRNVKFNCRVQPRQRLEEIYFPPAPSCRRLVYSCRRLLAAYLCTRDAVVRVLQDPYQPMIIRALFAQVPSCPRSYRFQKPVQTEFAFACPYHSFRAPPYPSLLPPWNQNMTTTAAVIVQTIVARTNRTAAAAVAARFPLSAGLPPSTYLR